MARVIYTGPLNPVIFARAKKEAEKAERIKGYTPRVIKTPAHTVVYSKTGPEVKAVVMDMLAPITFSTPGSAIPVRPSFLHLHPDLPEKLYGRANYATASGFTKNCGIGLNDRYPWGALDYIGIPFIQWKTNLGGSGNVDAARRARQHYREITHSVNNLVALSTNSDTPYDGMESYWPIENGSYPDAIITSVLPPVGADGNAEVNNAGAISIAATTGHAIVSASLNCNYENKKYYTPASPYYGYAGEFQKYGYTYSSVASGVFLSEDIRMDGDGKFSKTSIEGGPASSITVALSLDREIQAIGTNVTPGGYYKSNTNRVIESFCINYNESVTSADGGVLFAVLSSEIYLSGSSDTTITPTTYTGSFGFSTIDHIEQEDFKYNMIAGVVKNLSRTILNGRMVLSDSVTREFTAVEAVADNKVNEKTLLEKRVYVSGSIVGFNGVHIFAKVYNSIIGVAPGAGGDPKEESKRAEKTKYAEGSVFAGSHLAYYFDIFNGEYARNDDPQWMPPAITTDGICLPHAWFFVRGNETRETDFYPNNHNRLSIVIYPQGRHEFSVDEAEIVSVELNHTPRFVVKPGGSIAFNMQAIFDGDPLVPYVVNGLVEELDEDGKPTGFYLAADGAVEGVFKAYQQSEVYRLSPRQRLDAYRMITVETTTERKYGVQATFEVFGSGVRVQPGPPSITLECTNTSVLAGQTTVFYVTATHIALGSKLRYEIKREGAVVSAGYLTIVGGGAGYVEYVAPFTVQSNGGSPQRYVLANPLTGTAAPSVQEFEFSIIHDQAPPPETFSVRYSQESYASASDRPAALPMPPMFFMGAAVSVNGSDQAYGSNAQQTLINRLYYSLKSKKVYALFWDGQSCEVSSLLKQNPDTGQYEYNPDWKEVPFDYPPAVDPYGTPGALEPYVYAYLEYEKNRTGA